MFIPFSNTKKAYLQILKNLAQFFCSSLFQILTKHTYKSQNTLFILIRILKETIWIKTIIQTVLIKTIIQIDKRKTKYKYFSLLYIRMNGKSINLDNKNIKKSDFYNKNNKIFYIDDIDVNKILVSKKE